MVISERNDKVITLTDMKKNVRFACFPRDYQGKYLDNLLMFPYLRDESNGLSVFDWLPMVDLSLTECFLDTPSLNLTSNNPSFMTKSRVLP